MSRRLKAWIAIVLAAAVAVVISLPLAQNTVITWGVSLHQKSITRELKLWGQEFSHIRDQTEASRAVDRLKYIQGYYVPGNGYRGSAKTETELEAQRQETLATIVRSLEEFTGKRYGLNVEQWEAWRNGDMPDQRDGTVSNPQQRSAP